ncbi:MAG: hypothetical protein ACOCZ9_03830, partial [Spirochaetota bacterium]
KRCILLCCIVAIAVVLPGSALYAQNDGKAPSDASGRGDTGVSAVEGLEVEREGNLVRVHVQPTESDERSDSGQQPDSAVELVAFRSIRPIDSSDALAESVEVARLPESSSSFVDNPAPGVPAYYAVFSAHNLTETTLAFRQGRNVTATAITLPRDTATAAVASPDSEAFTRRRSRPLPRLTPEQSPVTGEQLPPRALPRTPRRPVSSATERAIQRILERLPEPDRSLPELRILEPEREDQPSNIGDTAITLRQIVRTTVRDRRWDDAVEYLEGLLTLPLVEEERARAHYYLGVARFFREEYRHAVLSLLQAQEQEQLYEYTRPWIETALERISEEE